MKKLQNIVLGLWSLLIVLFAAFNWDLLWRESPITMLFMEFSLPWLLWLVVGALHMPQVMMLLASTGARRAEKQAAAEIDAIKTKAFGQRDAELEKLAQGIHDKLETTLKSLTAGGGSSDDSPAEATPDADNSSKK